MIPENAACLVTNPLLLSPVVSKLRIASMQAGATAPCQKKEAVPCYLFHMVPTLLHPSRHPRSPWHVSTRAPEQGKPRVPKKWQQTLS
jgi:hypothetical protein